MTTPDSSKFRSDIEGLRAVAVLLVLFFHAGLPPKGGYIGVDIFFVISGYLITGLLIFEAETTGTISLARFYARRAKRLLPAASLVLLASAVLSYVWGPPLQRSEFGLDVVAAASYVVNWRFAARSVDYLAEDIGRSPVLHFWSLAVEEQFYFAWPILILLVLLLWKASSKRFSLQVALAIALALVLVPSFFWSVRHTSESPTEAFFETTTRLWELSVGAMLAVVSPKLQGVLPRGLSTPLTILGAVFLAIAALGFGEDTSWPGYYALAPTVGTAFVIAGGTVSRHGIGYKALSFRPLVWVGGMSYSLYLWHWPLLVLGIDWLELEVEKWGGILVAASFVPAWLSRRFVENPLRVARSLSERPALALSFGGNLSLFSVAAGLTLTIAAMGEGSSSPSEQGKLALQVRKGAVHATPKAMGAGALGSNPKKARAGRPQRRYDRMTPDPGRARSDVPRAYRDGCQAQFDATKPKWCTIGDPRGKLDVVVLGDSKILQYFESLDIVGQALGWKIRVGTKSACAFTGAKVRRRGDIYEECAAFRDAVLAELRKQPPDLVITSQSASEGTMNENDTQEASREGMVEGLVDVWSELDSMGAEVIVVLDNPHPPEDVAPVYECLLEHPEDATQCDFQRRRGEERSAEETQLEASKRFRRAQVVDLTDFICPADKCAPVIGDVLVYRQGSHITNTYARSLAPILGQKLKKAYDVLAK